MIYISIGKFAKRILTLIPIFERRNIVLNFETSLRNKISVSSNWRGNNILVATRARERERERERERDEEKERKKEKETHAFSEMWLVWDAWHIFECPGFKKFFFFRRTIRPRARYGAYILHIHRTCDTSLFTW